MVFNFNIELKNEINKPVGNAAVLLAGSFMRIQTNEEFVIQKIDVFIKRLLALTEFELDEADVELFKKCVLVCDAIQLVKSTILHQLKTPNK
jgi:hypothetical protein